MHGLSSPDCTILVASIGVMEFEGEDAGMADVLKRVDDAKDARKGLKFPEFVIHDFLSAHDDKGFVIVTVILMVSSSDLSIARDHIFY